MSPTKRGIKSKDKKNRARYVQAKYKELKQHNFFARIQELCQSESPYHTSEEQLDNDWLRDLHYRGKLMCGKI